MRRQRFPTHHELKCDDSYTSSGYTHASSISYDELMDSVDPEATYSDMYADYLVQSSSAGRYGYKLYNQQTEHLINGKHFCSRNEGLDEVSSLPSKENREGSHWVDWWYDFFTCCCWSQSTPTSSDKKQSDSFDTKSKETIPIICCSSRFESASHSSLYEDSKIIGNAIVHNTSNEQTKEYYIGTSMYFGSAQNAVSYKNPTRLFQLIQRKQWDLVYKRIHSNPEELRTWMYKATERKNESISWTVLPIHTACICGCPDVIMKCLIDFHPRSVTTGDSARRLPIHLACYTGKSANIVRLLLQASPQTIYVADIFGHKCRDIALGSKGPAKDEILRILDRGALWQHRFRPPRLSSSRIRKQSFQINKRCCLLREMNPLNKMLRHRRRFT